MREHTNRIIRQLLAESKETTEDQELLDEARRTVRKGARRRLLLRRLSRITPGKLAAAGGAAALGGALLGYGIHKYRSGKAGGLDDIIPPGAATDEPTKSPYTPPTSPEVTRRDATWADRPPEAPTIGKRFGAGEHHDYIIEQLQNWLNSGKNKKELEYLKLIIDSSGGELLDLNDQHVAKKFRQVSEADLRDLIKDLEGSSKSRVGFDKVSIKEMVNSLNHYMYTAYKAFIPPTDEDREVTQRFTLTGLYWIPNRKGRAGVRAGRLLAWFDSRVSGGDRNAIMVVLSTVNPKVTVASNLPSSMGVLQPRKSTDPPIRQTTTFMYFKNVHERELVRWADKSFKKLVRLYRR